ncbi:hypothetical protein AOQ84DRAFT_20529 [Glonium stellatum]|uniref:Uncharacterized protein n=1 Tax=Glonium stellatum TaxID=574774 RepID=A0A8E2F3Y7_9PEZI|nr:hypothetical protein AOQ84DRAFT_20529 [Glonium stellatum]
MKRDICANSSTQRISTAQGAHRRPWTVSIVFVRCWWGRKRIAAAPSNPPSPILGDLSATLSRIGSLSRHSPACNRGARDGRTKPFSQITKPHSPLQNWYCMLPRWPVHGLLRNSPLEPFHIPFIVQPRPQERRLVAPNTPNTLSAPSAPSARTTHTPHVTQSLGNYCGTVSRSGPPDSPSPEIPQMPPANCSTERHRRVYAHTSPTLIMNVQSFERLVSVQGMLRLLIQTISRTHFFGITYEVSLPNRDRYPRPAMPLSAACAAGFPGTFQISLMQSNIYGIQPTHADDLKTVAC